jgi:splicing factor 3B subunit 4
MHAIPMYGKPLKVSHAAKHSMKHTEIGANLFVGNLDPSVTEPILHEAFGVFGNVIKISIERNNVSGASKRFALVSFDNFDSSDSAIAALNG